MGRLGNSWRRRIVSLRDLLSFSGSVRSLVDSLNREIETPDKPLSHLGSHPAGFVRAIAKRRLTMAEAYLLLGSHGPERYQERLAALAVLVDNAWHAKTFSMPINTARVQIALMKESVQARGDLRRQHELMSDFTLASYGQEPVIRRLLRELDLIEVPELGRPLSELDLGWDGHLHDLLSQGTKTPSQLLVDAFIKGISRLTVVYYDLADPRVFEEALEAARLLGVHVEIGIELSVGRRGERLHFMYLPPQDGTPASLKRFLAAHPEELGQFFTRLADNAQGRKRTVVALLEEFNRTRLKEINSRFRNLPFLQAPALRVEELEEHLRWGQASHIHLGQVVTEQLKGLLHKRVLYLKSQYQHSLHRLKQGESSSWEVDNLRQEYQRARAEYAECRPDRLAEHFGLAARRHEDYDSAFASLADLDPVLQACGGRLAFIHPLSQGAENAVRTLIREHRRIAEVETFNASDSGFRDPADLRRLNRLVELLDQGRPAEVEELLAGWRIEGLTTAEVQAACAWYQQQPLLARCGSDYIGGVTQVPGMGFIFASRLCKEGRRLLERNRHPTLPVTIARLVAQQRGLPFGEDGNEEGLYILSPPKPMVPNLVGDEHVDDRVSLRRFWRYLNPSLKGLIKILVGFTPAYLVVGPWYAALWLGITGLRNLLADLVSTAGLSVRLWRTDSIDRTNLANSMFWTGFSVPILHAAKTGFDLLWPTLFGATGGFLQALAKFWVIAFANGLYITTHNRLRGFDRQVIRVNFFRTVLSWPLATVGSYGFDPLAVPAIVQSKIWSDIVAGLTEGTSKFLNRLKLRQRDLLQLFRLLLGGDRLQSQTALLDVLYVWSMRDRGRSAFVQLLRGRLQKLGPAVQPEPSDDEKRLILAAWERLHAAFHAEGNLEELVGVVLRNYSGRDAVVLTALLSEQHGEFASWLERHRPNDLRSRTPPPQSLSGSAPLPPAGARTLP
ncbi:MAG: hypothetical protein RBU45_14800 [Myxococcota bacterium]|jgi:hypothetical protein|nr:hypothetical protein [Myxococcota bacterium]